ncbi:DNA polymerase IV [Paracandidimonas soli]|uniref:DNA polymerase IV n=1 Tax=Paracandidimonas soli TaxID=1917182 RepID=A0A4R3VG25_9BURK|nr:DNA polymerase IV [Paracandidimonas soli]TCV02639.1 DNA polymerase-4 [Paracandidimonas soli]
MDSSLQQAERWVAHLDMDAFYASVELLRYPELRGLPVVVGGGSAVAPIVRPDGTREFRRLRGYAGRGVATTSTYEARALGVFSAMGLMKAAQLAPDALLLPADFTQYRKYSRLFKEAVTAIAPRMEDRGIDEIYIDLSEFGPQAPEVARRIKAAVQEATGLTCSIGLAPNKLLAKIGSDLDKPSGFTLLDYDSVPERIWPLPVRKINGIGPKSEQRLKNLGILTVGELAKAPPDLLQEHFSLSYARWLLAVAHGRDDRVVQTESERKSFSRETTFDRDLHAVRDRQELSGIFTALCEQVADDLQRRSYVGRTIGIKLRFADFRTVTRDMTLPEPTCDAGRIRHAAGLCLKRVPLERRIRLLGVRVGSISHGEAEGGQDAGSRQLTLY